MNTRRFLVRAGWRGGELRARPGFTLIELLAVIVIIAILLGFIFMAAMDAERRAQERATQTLIQKLDTGIQDRLDALMETQPSANYAHGYLASIYSPLAVTPTNSLGSMPPLLTNGGQLNSQIRTSLRAQAIALYDYIKSEMPDVFTLDPNFSAGGSYSGPYPLRFAGVGFPGTPLDTNGLGNFMLPMGHMVLNAPTSGSFGDANVVNGVLSSTFPNLGFTGSGIFGASYNAVGGLYKNLGYYPQGYNGVDDGGIPGLVDDWAEGVNSTNQAIVIGHLSSHTHKTARAEMLYSLLVEGSGPWGSVFARDDFTDKEVQDTDGDGMPEFVDAWGEPLQFFRWPIFHHSIFQRGMAQVNAGGSAWSLDYPYFDPWDQRERDPLDPSNQLTALGWWSNTGIGGLAANSALPQGLQPPTVVPPASPLMSGGAIVFSTYFHTLAEPLQALPIVGSNRMWDMSSFQARRAYYTKPLILSAGQDQQPGVFLYSDAVLQGMGNNAAIALIANENGAIRWSVNDFIDFTVTGQIPWSSQSSPPTISYSAASGIDPANPTSYDIQQAGQDDITNHNLSTSVGSGGSS